MKLDKEQYEKIYQKHSGRSNLIADCLWAFFTGGVICTIGEIIRQMYISNNMTQKAVPAAVSITMVFMGVALTAFKVYHKIADKAGAGTLVPITGFANAVSSAAVEFKSEGIVLGTCVKMFTIAGPVIVFGTSASIIYGLILLIMR